MCRADELRFCDNEIMKAKTPIADAPAVEKGRKGSLPRLQRILVPTDFSPLSRVAVDAALSLFKYTPATSLTLLHVVEPIVSPGITDPGMMVDFTLEARVEAAETELEHLRDVYGPQMRLEARLLTGSPARTLCDLAADEHFDLIVLSSHGHTGLNRILIGSVAEQVVQEAHCPVLVVKLPRNELGQFLPDPADLKLDHILVGYDHRRGADLALQKAVDLAGHYKSGLTLVHALEPIHFGASTDPKKEAACIDAAMLELSGVRARHLPESAHWRLLVQAGYPWDVITACAKQIECDLIVVGPHDHTRWGHSFVGSTAQRVVRLAPCAVLTIK
jgi:nucleotide-binding universal stress UspA family protein